MAEAVGQRLRQEVGSRAGGRCEYCLSPEWLLLAGCEVDHVISRKHGGKTEPANLALSCARFNRAKGSDISSVDPATGRLFRLFNPRTDRWSDHFKLDGALLTARTIIGTVTISLLRLNDEPRLEERAVLLKIGEFPRLEQ